jgi:acetyl esterase/lipase
MIFPAIQDWDAAYANSAHIAGGDRWPDAWAAPAAAFREQRSGAAGTKLDIAYGAGPRRQLDLFLPNKHPKGLVVFVHGGYWMALDKSFWSHLARGSLESGYAVAMPSYTLCPATRIAGITAEIGMAIAEAAELVEGEVRLTGHSAGGHLVTRMISATSPLPEQVRSRIVNTVSIAGVHDLRPLRKTAMNATLQIDAAEAAAESPALLEPIDGARLTCWVGASERSEFVRQSALLANVWRGLGARTAFVQEPDRHHFNVIDGLADPDHVLTRCLLE